MRGASLILALALAGCGAAQVPADREAAFQQAVQDARADRHAAALSAAWHAREGLDPDAPRHDRALRLMAQSAEGLGLSYAASLWYLEIARARRAPTLLPASIRGLRRIIEGGPHDADTLITGFLATAETAGLPADLQAFVDYHRGLHDARQGLDDWARARFADLPPESPYAARARYVEAVQAIDRAELDAADAALAVLAERAQGPAAAPLPDDLLREVRLARARLAMHRGDLDAALSAYGALRAESPDDAELLLEMAWLHYDRGDTRRALGLLLALDAPIYADLIAPERFLLEALALRRLCQFGPARRAAVRLRARHGDALEALYAGRPLVESSALRTAAALRSRVRPLSAFVARLEAEQGRLADLPITDEARRGLAEVYTRGLAEARLRLDAALAEEVDALAADLLAAEEGVRLILHELGVALLRGRHRPDGPPEAPVTPPAEGRALFRFTGEFWTDELDDLEVVVEDRCVD